MHDLARWLGEAALWLRAAAPAVADSGYRDVAPAEHVPAPLFVGLAYGAIWIVLMAYLLVLWRRQGELAARLARLQRELDPQREPDASHANPGAHR